MTEGKLIAIGGAYIDINAPQFPLGENGLELEKEYVGSEYIIEPGGSAVNFARICASLEIPTTFIGKVGKDEFGSMLSRLLLNQLVEPLLVTSEAVTTNISFNMVNENGKTVMAVVGSANQELTPDEVYTKASEGVADSSYLYLGGCFKLRKLLPAFAKLSDDAKHSNTMVVLDHARLNTSVTNEEKQIVKELALAADFYFPSTDEFMELWEVKSIEDGLRLLQEKSQGVTIVKDGSNGAVTIINDEIVKVPAYTVKPLHTVGAGDSFNAGVIAGHNKGMDLLDSIRFGCATAALKISRQELPTYRDVEQFIAEQKI